MDLISLLRLVGLALAAIVGGGMVLALVLRGMRGATRAARRGEALAVVYHIDTNTIERGVPLVKVDNETWNVADGHRRGGLNLFKLPNAKPWHDADTGKPIYSAIAYGSVGYLVPHETLLKIGLSSLLINDKKWDSDNPLALVSLISNLAQREREVRGNVKLSSGTKIGFVIDVPTIIGELVGLMGGMGLANLSAQEEKIVQSKKIAERMRVREIGPHLTRAIVVVAGIMMVLGIVWILAKVGAFGGKPPMPPAETIVQNITTLTQTAAGAGG